MKELWQSTTPLSITTNTYPSSSNRYNSLYPGPFKRAVASEYPQYSGNNQHDAQEFMRFLVSGLHDHMKREVSRKYDPFMLKDATTRYMCRMYEDSEVFVVSAIVREPCYYICILIGITVLCRSVLQWEG